MQKTQFEIIDLQYDILSKAVERLEQVMDGLDESEADSLYQIVKKIDNALVYQQPSFERWLVEVAEKYGFE